MDLNKIGDWKISVLETGDFRLDGGAMMGSVPKVLWAKTNPADEQNRIDLALRCLLLDDGKNIVLIESGIGDHNSEKFKKIFDIKQQEKALSNALSDLDYSIKDITHVILTHLHFDHAGGAVFKTVSGDFKPAFPNATYYISNSNWEAALNPSPKDRASYLKHNFICLNDYGVLEIIPDNTQILDGIETYIVNGHTHGQQLIKVKGDNETLVFCSDLIPLKSHIKIPWIMGYDLNAELTLKEKELFLSEAADKGWILFFYHDPNSVAVKITKTDKYFEVIDECVRRRD